MPVLVGVMNATPLLPNESSKLNLNGGSFAGYPDAENSGAGDRPVKKRSLPERKYFVERSVISILSNLSSDLAFGRFRSLKCPNDRHWQPCLHEGSQQ